jgi:hypothetical protein
MATKPGRVTGGDDTSNFVREARLPLPFSSHSIALTPGQSPSSSALMSASKSPR